MSQKLTALFTVASVAGALIIATATIANASDYGRHGHVYDTHASKSYDYGYGGGRDWSRQAYKKPSRQHVLEKRINRRVKNTTLPLRRIFGLGRDYNGYRIDAIMVKLGSKKRRGRVKLRVNGHVVDRKSVGNGRVLWLRPGDVDVIGRGLKTLQLEFDGKMFVKDVKIKMTRISKRRHSTLKHRYAPASSDLGSQEAAEIARIILRQLTWSLRGQ